MHSKNYSTWSLCVCLSVNSYSGSTGYAVAYKVYQKEKGHFPKTTVFKRCGVKTSKKKPIYAANKVYTTR